MEANWTSLCLADCGTWLSGGTPSKSQLEYWHGDIPWVSPKDMNERFIKDAQDHISLMGVNNGSRLVPPHTILFVVRSMTLAHKFQIAITERAVAFNQDLKAIVCKENVYPYFLFYSLLSQSNTILQLVDEASHGTKRLRTEVLEKLNISLPPLAEQCRIAHFFKALDDKIELNRQMNNTLESIAQALFKSWFVDFDPVRAKMEGREPYGMDAETAELFPDGFEDSELGEIPGGWKVSSLGELFPQEDCVLTGPFGSNLHSSDYRSQGVPLILVKHVNNGKILEEDLPLVGEHKSAELSRYRLKEKDIVFTRVGAVGRSAYVYPQHEGWLISGQMLRVRLPNDETLHPRYLAQIYLLPSFIGMVENYALGTTRPSLNTSLLKSFTFLLPPIRIQNNFVRFANNLDNKIQQNLAENQTLTAIRDALLPKLLSGQIRVRDAEKMVESAV